MARPGDGVQYSLSLIVDPLDVSEGVRVSLSGRLQKEPEALPQPSQLIIFLNHTTGRWIGTQAYTDHHGDYVMDILASEAAFDPGENEIRAWWSDEYGNLLWQSNLVTVTYTVPEPSPVPGSVLEVVAVTREDEIQPRYTTDDPIWIRAELLSAETRDPIKKGKLSFELDGKTSSKVTDSKGRASWSLGRLDPGAYGLKAEFAGIEGKYLGVVTEIPVTVVPAGAPELPGLPPIIREIVQGLQIAFKPVGDALAGLVDRAIGGISMALLNVIGAKPALIGEVETELARATIHEEMFQTPEIRAVARKLKEQLKGSPQDLPGLIDVTVIQPTQAALQALIQAAGVPGEALETAQARTGMKILAIATDLAALIAVVDVVSTALSGTLFRQVGRGFDRIIGVMGVNNIGAFIIGAFVGGFLEKPLGIAINRIARPAVPGLGEAWGMLSEGIIDEATFNSVAAGWGFKDEWIAGLKAKFDHELSRDEMRTLYQVGQLKAEDVAAGLFVQGYREPVLSMGVEAITSARLLRLRRTTLLDLIDLAAAGVLTPGELSDRLAATDYNPAEISEILVDLNLEIRRRRISERLPVLQAAYSAGQIDDATLTAALLALGFTGPRAKELLELARLKLLSRAKPKTTKAAGEAAEVEEPLP